MMRRRGRRLDSSAVPNTPCVSKLDTSVQKIDTFEAKARGTCHRHTKTSLRNTRTRHRNSWCCHRHSGCLHRHSRTSRRHTIYPHRNRRTRHRNRKIRLQHKKTRHQMRRQRLPGRLGKSCRMRRCGWLYKREQMAHLRGNKRQDNLREMRRYTASNCFRLHNCGVRRLHFRLHQVLDARRARSLTWWLR